MKIGVNGLKYLKTNKMKNIHILLTDKPSSLFEIDGHLIINKEQLIQPKYYRNIYITSYEEIKEGDWFAVDLFKITGESGGLHIEKCIKLNDIWCNDFDVVSTRHKGNCKKIILTTDQDLIKDGVQAIDDEFLEWFVQNPSCEEVEVIELKYKSVKTNYTHSLRWGIIIPQEETKQETLEQVAERLVKEHPDFKLEGYTEYQNGRFNGIIEGIEWQQERMYSEEDMISFAWFLVENLGQYSCDRTAHFEGKYLEKFKNK